MPFNIIIGRNESDKKKFGERGTILLGRSYVQMGRTTSLSNYVYLDVIKAHVVFVVGKRGGGKCLVGDTLLSLSDGSLVPIKDIQSNNSEVMSLNPELKIRPTKKEDFFKREVNKIIKLKLRSGKKIELTPEHPLLTIKGWKPANELSIKSRIAVPRKINCFGKEFLEDNKIKLLAYLIAEGHLRQSWVLFSNYDEIIVEDFKKSVLEFNPELEIKKHSKPGCFRVTNKNNKYEFKENPLKTWLKTLNQYDKYSKEKFIPEIIFKLPKEKIALFLNRLFSCDGSIDYSDCWEISYSSSSNRLIKEVQHLLLRFGIPSKLRTKKIKYKGDYVTSYEIVLNKTEGSKFVKEIGFFGKKQEKSKIFLTEIIEIKNNPNIDTIPKEIWDIYRPQSWVPIGKYFGYAYPKAMRERIRYSPSRNTLFYIAEADKNEFLRTLACSDIFWDEIVSIEEKEGAFTVYDICVPKNHNFIANDIIVHNSYSSSVIAEGITDLPEEISNNLAVIMFDSMGVYWTMKYPNEKDTDLLEQWNLKPKGLEKIKIFTPEGKFEEAKQIGLPSDYPFSIKASELTGEDWRLAFELPISSPVSILIEKILGDFAEKNLEDYTIDLIIEAIKKDTSFSNETRNEAINRFKGAKSWGLISDKGTKIDVLVQKGSVSVLDLSAYASSSGGWGIKALVIGLVAKKIFIERMASRQIEEIEAIKTGYSYFKIEKETNTEQKQPLVWFVVDECLPAESIIETDNGKQRIIDIIKNFENKEKTKVLSFDQKENKFVYKEVSNIYRRGIKDLVRITTETGKVIKCTANHKIYTSKGFEEAQHSLDIASPLIYNYSRNKKLIQARLLGYIFGDGYLSKNGTCVGFSGKNNINDLLKIKEDLTELGLSSGRIYTRITKSLITDIHGHTHEVNGTSQEIRSSTKGHKLFEKLGAPRGKKIKANYSIPLWLKTAKPEEISEFLAALMGADGTAPTINKNCKRDFNPIRLSFNYINTNEKEAERYALEIKGLFDKIGIEISSITKRPGNIRKDGSISSKKVLTLSKSTKNIVKYLEIVGYRYCKKKEILGKQWLNYLKAKLFLEKRQNLLKQKARKLHIENGLGKVKIARELGIPSYQVRDWIYYNNTTSNRAPYSFKGFKEWITERVIGENLFENITSRTFYPAEEVFDISVEDTHNFIANNFLVHNCHEYLPQEGKTAATDALVTILREGRQPGLSLLLISQQPGKIHSDVLTQSDIVISHRLTAKRDVDALNSMMQSYLGNTLTGYLDMLPAEPGAAIILDDNSERLYPIRVRPKFSWHGGEAPTAIHYKRSANLGI
jgi:intein/homing endonuclease